MTGYTVHTGASKKFVSGWDRVFSATAETQIANVKKKKGKASSGKKKKK